MPVRCNLAAALVTTAHVWRGQHGAVVLGETQHRVARYLEDLTRHGWIRLSTATLAERLGLERSEAYRITSRLRALGLFGIADDAGGARGGRRWWRTPTTRASTLDGARHRVAWSRVVARARARARALLMRSRADRPGGPSVISRPVAATPPAVAGRSFADLMRAAGLGALMDEWKGTVT